jgi:hypothetical protein
LSGVRPKSSQTAQSLSKARDKHHISQPARSRRAGRSTRWHGILGRKDGDMGEGADRDIARPETAVRHPCPKDIENPGCHRDRLLVQHLLDVGLDLSLGIISLKSAALGHDPIAEGYTARVILIRKHHRDHQQALS